MALLLAAWPLALGTTHPAGPVRSATAPAAATLAVLNFDNNTGSTDYDAMGRGLAAMMITDLSTSNDLKVVEREHMQDVLSEQQMQHSAMFDSTTAVKAGKLLGAQYITAGSLAAADPKLRIDMRVINVETGQIVQAAQVTGPKDKIFDMEQQLADKVLKGMNVTLSPDAEAKLRKQQASDRQMGFDSFMSLSTGIAQMDAGNYVDAAGSLRPLLMKAPDSRLVELTYQEAKHRAEQAAKEKAKAKVTDKLRSIFHKP